MLFRSRGQVIGVDVENAQTVVRATAPLSELGRYASQLRAMTGGYGEFTMEMSHYDVVPNLVQQKIAAERNVTPEKEEE